jgi:hypothetical protein
MDQDALLDRYYDEAMLGTSLEDFVTRALAGEWGPVARPTVMRFLDRLEVILLGNIDTKLEESPGSQDAAEQAAEAARAELARARALVADG